MLCPRCGSEAPDWAEQCDNCGLALLETQSRINQLGPFRVGDVVAERYEIRERGAVEALGWSYVAIDQEDERPVALRAIRPTILPSREVHDRFARRLQPVLGLQLAGLARHLRVDREAKTSFVVSELVPDGVSLRSLVELRRHDARAFGAQETIAVLTLAAEVLEGARSVACHGDLRPDRIVLREADLKIEGYGLAALLPREETVRALSSTPSHASYLAPEVLEGTAFDTRSDVYSLAVIACELLTGRVPPEPGAAVREVLLHVPSVATGVLERALSHGMAERDSSPIEMVESLAVVLGVEPLRGRAPASASVDETDPSVAVGPARGGTQPTMPRIPDPDELVSTLPRARRTGSAPRSGATVGVEADPAIAASPAAEATQQISMDMLEPVDGPEPASPVPSDPATPAEASAEGTQQITADMIEPAEAGGGPEQTDGRPTEPSDLRARRLKEMESMRSLGLDPRLVRAARKLDRQRRGEAPDEAPTIRSPAAPRMTEPEPLAPEPARAAAAPDAVVQATPAPFVAARRAVVGPAREGRAEPGADDDLGGADDDLGRADDDLGRADDDLGRADDGLGRADDDLGRADDDLGRADDDLGGADDGSAFEEPGFRTVPRLAHEVAAQMIAEVEASVRTSPFAVIDEPADDDDEARTGVVALGPEHQVPEGPEPTTERQAPGRAQVPAAMVGGSIGPVHTSVAGTSLPSSAPPARAEPPEPAVLPAVVVDDALHAAFGPPPVRDEPTYRVFRPPDPAEAVHRPAVPARRSPGMKAWMLPVLVVAAVATLLLGMGLATWLFG